MKASIEHSQQVGALRANQVVYLSGAHDAARASRGGGAQAQQADNIDRIHVKLERPAAGVIALFVRGAAIEDVAQTIAGGALRYPCAEVCTHSPEDDLQQLLR